MRLNIGNTRARALIAAAAIAALAVAAVLGLGSGGGDGPGSEADPAAPARSSAAATAVRSPDASAAAPEQEQPLRYDVEYPAIGYSTTPPSDRIAALEAQLAAGDTELEHRADRGWLGSLLRALDIDRESQLLVFSTTSLQIGNIRPRTPRAIYFNDDTYVAWVQGGGPIEIASMDPNLGPIFYTLDQSAAADPGFERQTGSCLRCHDSLSLSGGGVPRFILGSGYIGTRGNIVAHEGWILTSQQTPIRNRWGGWYVTGHHGDQVHLGNIVVKDVATLGQLDALRIGNLDSLDSLVDTSPYAADTSDIAALMVIQHQVDVQNEIARVAYQVRTALEDGGAPTSAPPAAAAARVADLTEPLVEALLFVGETELTDAIVGTSAFAQRFERRGPRDTQGRSLRELDLTKRLLEYPLSYLIYSRAFDSLPKAAKDYVYTRLADVLSGEDQSERFAHLSARDRKAVLEILSDTQPEFAAALAE